MINKKLIGIAVAAVMIVTTFVPSFAAEKAVKDPTAKQVKIQAMQAKVEKKAIIEAKKQQTALKLAATAEKLGVDITGLSNKDAKAKIKAAVVAKKATIAAKKQQTAQKLAATAAKLGVDITGLSNKDAKAKIKAAVNAKKAAIAAQKAAKAAKKTPKA